ncbi:hypothetical protein DH2020_005169 [Rehmannia glutinosa]|uniref:Uncharacterized protein n=1 Tax=Rehmannia glutinosa TaxID=99300 RepID=A0ABR0XRT6_REHGL
MFLKLGQTQSIVISSAEEAKKAFKHNDLIFSGRPRTTPSGKLSYNHLDIASPPHNEYWREMRKMIVVHLCTLEKVRSFRPLRQDELCRAIDEISRRASLDQVINLTEVVNCFSVNHAGRVLFGKRLFDEGQRFSKLMGRFQASNLDIFLADYVPLFGWIDKLSGASFRLDKNILIGTIDTSSSTIIWALTALVKKPSAMKKVQQEIRSSLVGRKVIKETLRLYPPNPLSLPRETTDRCIVDGYEIQPKTIVFMNTWAIGRDPDYWENPNEFMPELFLNRNIDFKGQDFGLLPFGSGRRSCPGLSLGVVVVEMALANLLYSFDWELPDGMSEEDIDTQGTQGLTMQKKNPLCLMAKTYF